MQTYVITCLKCKATRRIQVTKTAVGNRIDWLEQDSSPHEKIISGRERLDGEFGFQCVCGNNNLLTQQEAKTFANPAAPKPQEINEIVENLKVEKNSFQMVAA